MVLEHKNIRVFFTKKGRCIYISHLDLSRAVARALKRSGIDAWQTQGFHPHLYLTFALPLSLGTSSECESFDFRIGPNEDLETAVQRLNDALPEEIRATKIAFPELEPKSIMWADYKIHVTCDGALADSLIKEVVAKDEVIMEKRSKKGMKEVNIRDMFQVMEQSFTDKTFDMTLRTRAGVEINLNPSLVLEALCKDSTLQIIGKEITRIAVLTEGLEDFA